MKIANKISLSFLAIVIILSVTIFPIFYLVVRNNFKQIIEEKLESVVRSRTNHIETYLKMLKVSVGQLSKSVVLENLLKVSGKDIFQQGSEFKDAIKRLKRTIEANTTVYEFLLMDTAGKVVASSNESSVGQDKSSDSIFIGAQKDTYIKDAYYSEELKEPLIAVSTPFFNSQTGGFLGVLAARVKLNDLYDITTESVGLGKTEEVFIVNKYGFMITPSRFLKDTFLKQKVDTENVKRARLHESRRHILSEGKIIDAFLDYRGALVLGTHQYVPQMHWLVLVEIEAKEAFAPLSLISNIFIIIMFTNVMFAWLLGVFISKLITAPLRRLHKGVEIIGSGNLDYKVGIDTKDDVGQLSRAFDTMTVNLKSKTTSVESLNKEIAERKKIEKSLRESQDRYRSLFVSSRDAIMIIEPPDWRFTSANPATLEMFRAKNKEEFLSYDPWKLSPELQQDGRVSGEKAKEMIETAIREGFNFFEWVHRRLSGETFFAEVLLSRVELEGEVFLHVVVRDITERKRAQEQVNLAAQEWERTFNSIADFVFVQDKDFRILKANKAFLDAVKLESKDVIGKKCYEVLHKSDKPWPNCPFGKTITDNAPHSEEVDDQHMGIPLLVTISPIFDSEGKLIGSVHIAKDISEIKKAREELEKKNIELNKLNQIKSSFTSMVSHELRSPLAIIKESVGIVLEGLVGNVNDEQKDLLDTAKKNVDRLGRLINNVLDFQKMESGRMEYDIQENDINAVALEVHKAMGFLAVEKGLDFVLNLQENIPKVRFDKDKIIQVFTNLVSNAAKFTEKGSISITTRKEDNTVHVIVQDTGMGIKSEDMEKLFQPFEQLSGPRDKKKGGTGLGLSICKRIILAQNGKIWAESEEGKGSAFHFVLPIEEHRG